MENGEVRQIINERIDEAIILGQEDKQMILTRGRHVRPIGYRKTIVPSIAECKSRLVILLRERYFRTGKVLNNCMRTSYSIRRSPVDTNTPGTTHTKTGSVYDKYVPFRYASCKECSQEKWAAHQWESFVWITCRARVEWETGTRNWSKEV